MFGKTKSPEELVTAGADSVRFDSLIRRDGGAGDDRGLLVLDRAGHCGGDALRGEWHRRDDRGH